MANVNNNSVAQLFVSKDAPIINQNATNPELYDAATNPGGVKSGEICVFDTDWNPMVAGMTVTNTRRIYIVQGTPTGNRVETIPADRVRNWRGDSYVVATSQISHIGYNGATGSIPVRTVDAFYTITLVFNELDPTRGGWIKHRLRVEVRVPAGTTQAVIAQMLADAINNQATNIGAFTIANGYPVVATVVTDGTNYGVKVAIIDDVINTKYDITFQGSLLIRDCNCDDPYQSLTMAFTYTGGANVARNWGIGACPWLSRFEENMRPWRGHIQFYSYHKGVPLYVDCSLCYDMLSIEWDEVYDSDSVTGDSTNPRTLMLAVPNTQGLVNPLLAVLNPWFNSLELAFPNVTV